MSLSAIRCSGPFWEWVSKLREEYKGRSRADGFEVSLFENEVASAIMIFVELVRFKGGKDKLTIECEKILSKRKPKGGRRPIKRKIILEQTKPGTWQERLARGLKPDGFRIVTTREFKNWFDETRSAICSSGSNPLTQIEFTEALMALVKSGRYAKSVKFRKICRQVGSKRVFYQ